MTGAPFDLLHKADEGVGCGPWGPPHRRSSSEADKA
jgi:hypothetical protein